MATPHRPAARLLPISNGDRVCKCGPVALARAMQRQALPHVLDHPISCGDGSHRVGRGGDGRTAVHDADDSLQRRTAGDADAEAPRRIPEAEADEALEAACPRRHLRHRNHVQPRNGQLASARASDLGRLVHPPRRAERSVVRSHGRFANCRCAGDQIEEGRGPVRREVRRERRRGGELARIGHRGVRIGNAWGETGSRLRHASRDQARRDRRCISGTYRRSTDPALAAAPACP